MDTSSLPNIKKAIHLKSQPLGPTNSNSAPLPLIRDMTFCPSPEKVLSQSVYTLIIKGLVASPEKDGFFLQMQFNPWF